MLLALIFVVLPIAEVVSIIWVAHHVGILPMLVLLFGVSFAGGWLAKRVGLDVWRRFRATLVAGGVPSEEVADGALVLLGAVLLVVPGFITDILGLLLLVPAVRSLVKWVFWGRVRRRVVQAMGQAGRRRLKPIKVQAIRVADADSPQQPEIVSHLNDSRPNQA